MKYDTTNELTRRVVTYRSIWKMGVHEAVYDHLSNSYFYHLENYLYGSLYEHIKENYHMRVEGGYEV
jgi:hypothetical protein